ncbi:MAG: hypothetical protein SNJ64_06585 [Endomicrobiia bacterium]
MNTLFSDPLLVVAVVIGIMSLVLVFLLIEYYKKLKDTQFVSEVMKVSDKKEPEPKVNTVQQIPVAEQTEQKINTPETININNSDIVLAQINELANQINSINDNFKDLSAVVKNLSATTTQNTGLTEKHIEKLLTALQNIETIITSQIKSNSTNADKETLEEINAKLDNILKILSAILQQ